MRNLNLSILLFAFIAAPACHREEGVGDDNQPDLGTIPNQGPPACFEGTNCDPPDMATPKAAPDLAQPWTPPPPGNTCNQQTFPLTITKNAPNIHLVIDRSGSMSLNSSGNAPMGSETAKWEDLSSTLSTILSNYGDKANQWGMSLFPTETTYHSCTAGDIAVPLAAPAAAIPQINNAIGVYNRQNLLQYNGYTPTPAAIQGVIDHVKLDDTSRNNYVILMTDGLPKCATPQTGVTQLIAQLYAQSPPVRTFVIGFGSETAPNPVASQATDPAMLNDWAAAGHTQKSGATQYYQAADAAALQQAFQDIVGGVASCTFTVATTPADPSLVVGYINGSPVANNLFDGFSYDVGTQSVTFHGLSCAMIQNVPGTQVSVQYGCPAADAP